MGQQGVDQRAFTRADAGVDDQAGGLVDDQQVAVFVDDVERDRLGLQHAGPRRRLANLDLQAGRHQSPRLGRLATDQRMPIGDQPVGGGAAQMRQGAREVRVEPHPRFLGAHRQAVVARSHLGAAGGTAGAAGGSASASTPAARLSCQSV